MNSFGEIIGTKVASGVKQRVQNHAPGLGNAKAFGL